MIPATWIIKSQYPQNISVNIIHYMNECSECQQCLAKTRLIPGIASPSWQGWTRDSLRILHRRLAVLLPAQPSRSSDMLDTSFWKETITGVTSIAHKKMKIQSTELLR